MNTRSECEKESERVRVFCIDSRILTSDEDEDEEVEEVEKRKDQDLVVAAPPWLSGRKERKKVKRRRKGKKGKKEKRERKRQEEAEMQGETLHVL